MLYQGSKLFVSKNKKIGELGAGNHILRARCGPSMKVPFALSVSEGSAVAPFLVYGRGQNDVRCECCILKKGRDSTYQERDSTSLQLKITPSHVFVSSLATEPEKESVDVGAVRLESRSAKEQVLYWCIE